MPGSRSIALAGMVLHRGRSAGWDVRSVRDVLLPVGVVAVYVMLEWVSFLHEHGGLPVTPWNPGLGLMFAMIIVRGYGFGLLFFLAVLLAEIFVLRTDLSWPTILAIAAVVAGPYTLVALAARRWLRLDGYLFRPRDIFALVLAGAVGAVIVSVLLATLLLIVRHFDISDIVHTAMPLVVGDLLGIAVVSPIVLRLATLGRRATTLAKPASALEIAAFAVAIGSALWIVMRPASFGSSSMFYILFLPTVVAAVRYGLDGACAALAVVQLSLVALLQVQGFDLSRFTEYQLLMLVLTLTGLLVGVLVTERQASDLAARRAAEQLQEAQAVAARAARLNLVSGMAAALAHEVNQPLTAARALAKSVQQLMRRPDPDKARAEANLAGMIDQVDHAAAVVRRMREFLRRGEPQAGPLGVRMVLDEALALVQPLANAKRIDLSIEVPDTMPPIYGDRVQLQQVVINLVRNAIEAILEADRGEGRIRVTARLSHDAREVEMRVLDNGIGIAPERASTVFEPLVTSRPDGIGLGLAICKSIVQVHRGRIWLTANEPGWTEFGFTVPAAAAPSQEAQTS